MIRHLVVEITLTKIEKHDDKSYHIVDFPIPSPKKLSHLRSKLLHWFEDNGRIFPWRKTALSKYQIVISEILLQRTRAETVASFSPSFVDEFPSWKQLNNSSICRIQQYLQPIGLWRQRASVLHALAKAMVKKNGRLPKNRKEIEALPGVGQYIANAILLLCHGEPQPLLDANMARVLERVFGSRKLADIRYDPYLQEISLKVVQCNKAKQINWAILDLAAIVCRIRNPRCCACPLMSMCICGTSINK